MRTALGLFGLCALAACNRAPSFDEKYEEQSRHISVAANSIEKEVSQQISGAAAAEKAAAETQARLATPGNSPGIP